MNMRRFFAIISVLFLLVAGNYSHLETVFSATVATKDSLLQGASFRFSEKLSALTNESNAYAQSHGGVGSQEFKDYQKVNRAMATAVGEARDAYTIAFRDTTKTVPGEIYRDALLATVSSLNASRSGNPLLQQASSSEFITKFITELTFEADKKELIGQVETGTALSTTSQALISATKVAANPALTDKPEGCSGFFTTWTLTSCLDAMASWIIKGIFVPIASFLLYITATIFNYSVTVGILQFSKWAPDALYPIWVTVRQIVSLMIVFAGLYLGFLYILGMDEKTRFKKYLPWVIMFGLFVNFSYPLTRTAIDISNIISLNIYSTIAPLDPSNPDNGAGTKLRDALNVQGLLEKIETTGKQPKGNTSIYSTPGSIMAVILLLYAAYIFFMASAIMIARTLALVFISIASPILFIDSVLPMLGDSAMKLRKIFVDQLVVAPIFMIMLALTIKFMDVFKNALNISGSVNSTIIFFNLLFMTGMLHIMMKVTRNFSGKIGEAATNAMGKVGGFGLSVASAGTGMLARKGIGMAAAKLGESQWVQNNQHTVMGRMAKGATASLANSTFDLRNSSYIAGGLKKAGLGMSAGGKMGYTELAEAKIKDRIERGKAIPTYHKKDVYEEQVGADGKKTMVLKHREGDIDEDAVEAQKKFYNSAGGTTFMTRAQKDRIRDELKKHNDATAKTTKSEAETFANEEYIKHYEGARDKYTQNPDGTITTITKEEQQQKIMSNLYGQLEDTKKYDPDLRSKDGQALAAAVKKLEDKYGSRTMKQFMSITQPVKMDGYDELVSVAQQQDMLLEQLTKELQNMQTIDATTGKPIGDESEIKELITSIGTITDIKNNGYPDRYTKMRDRKVKNPDGTETIIQTKKSQRDALHTEIQQKISDIQRTDPGLTSHTAKILTASLDQINEMRESQEEAVLDAIQEIANAGSAESAERYRQRLSKDIRDEVDSRFRIIPTPTPTPKVQAASTPTTNRTSTTQVGGANSNVYTANTTVPLNVTTTGRGDPDASSAATTQRPSPSPVGNGGATPQYDGGIDFNLDEPFMFTPTPVSSPATTPTPAPRPVTTPEEETV